MEPLTLEEAKRLTAKDPVLEHFENLLSSHLLPTEVRATEWLIDGYMPEGNSLKIGHTQSKKSFSNVGEIGAMLGYIHAECENVSVRDTRNVIYFSEDVEQFNNMMSTYLGQCGLTSDQIADVFRNHLFVYDTCSKDPVFIQALIKLIEHLVVEKPTIDGLSTYKVPPVIYFDTLRFCFDIIDENANGLMSEVTKIIKSLKCPTVTVHHTGKAAEGDSGMQRSRGLFEEGVIIHGAGASSLVSNLEASFITSWDIDVNLPRVVANKKRQQRKYEICIAGGRTESKSALSRNGDWVKEDIWFPILKLYTLEQYGQLAETSTQSKGQSIQQKLITRLTNMYEAGVTQIEFKIGKGKAEVSAISKPFAQEPFTKQYQIAKQSYATYRDWLFKTANIDLPKSGIAILDVFTFLQNAEVPSKTEPDTKPDFVA